MESVRSRIHDDAKVIQVHYVIWIIGQHQTGGATGHIQLWGYLRRVLGNIVALREHLKRKCLVANSTWAIQLRFYLQVV